MEGAGEGPRLLIVDDETGFREALVRRLAKRGLTAHQAENGEACLACLDKASVDVVVLDVKMPGMDGVEVLRRIRQRHPRIEVILLTGQASAQDGVEGIKAGAFDYLLKPIELEHLRGKIDQAYAKILRREEREREAGFRARAEQYMATCRRMASLGTLAAGVAHEINNPLAIIAESAGWMKRILQKEQPSAPRRREDLDLALDRIERALGRAKGITHQLLEFVQKERPVLSEVDPAELIEEALLLLEGQVLQRGVQIGREIDPSTGPLWSDPYPLRQALIHLLTNAIQASAPGGRVTIRLRGSPSEISLAVRDKGEGIPRENLDRIFDPFFTTREPGQGTGLGLFVSRGMIEKLGGSLEVESTLGQGSEFLIRLPRNHLLEKERRQDGPAADRRVSGGDPGSSPPPKGEKNHGEDTDPNTHSR